MNFENIRGSLKSNKILLTILILGFFLLFLSLGNRQLFGDETFTTVVSTTVLENGFPLAQYEGYTINPKHTAHFNVRGQELYTWNTWGQYYITAAMLAVFGLNEFALRMPFALLGFLTLILLFVYVKEVTKNKALAKVSTLILATSVPFILHMRQVRWYALVTFLTMALLYSYHRYRKTQKSGLFVLSALLLFYSSIFTFMTSFGAIFLYHTFFVKKRFKKYVWSWVRVSAIIALLTAPWFFFTGQSSKASILGVGITKYLLNFALNWYYIFLLIFPAAFLLFFILPKVRRDLSKEPFRFLIFFVIVSILITSLKFDHLPAIRYLVHLIPIFSIFLAFFVLRTAKVSKILAVSLTLILLLTNVLHVFPFFLMEDLTPNLNADISDFNKQKFVIDSLGFRPYLPLYLYEITHEYDSTEELIAKYMNANGRTTDTFTAANFANTVFATSLYTDMQYVAPEDITILPDWIIVRSFGIGYEKVEYFFTDVNSKVELTNYERIRIQTFDQRWADSPDPINHRFKTDDQGVVYLYHLW